MSTSERNKGDVDAGRPDSDTASSEVDEPRTSSSASARDTRSEELRDSGWDRNEEYGEVY